MVDLLVSNGCSDQILSEFNNPDLEEMWGSANMLFIFLATAASDKLAAMSKKKSTKKKKKKVTMYDESMSPSYDESIE